MIGICLALTLILVVCTLLPLLPYEVWWIRIFDFPRLQLAIFGGLVTVLNVFFLNFTNLADWIIFAVCILCTLYQGWWILPYTPLYPRQVPTAKIIDPAMAIRVLVANVLQSNQSYQSFIELVKKEKPHIFVTLETNLDWQSFLNQLEEVYPYSVKYPLENRYGMHVYSQYPLIDPKIHFLVMDKIPSIHTKVILPSGQNVLMHFLHPLPPRPQGKGGASERNNELMLVAERVAKNKNTPTIVTGDLNDVAWSNSTKDFLRSSHLLDPRVGRGMCNTFNAKHWFLRWPLDHLFHTHHFRISCMYRLPEFGSDHFAILVELVLV